MAAKPARVNAPPGRRAGPANAVRWHCRDGDESPVDTIQSIQPIQPMQRKANKRAARGRLLRSLRASVWAAVALVGLVGLAGCPAEQSERCRQLCKDLVSCVEESNTRLVIDGNECTTTCTSLERDPEGKALVDQYAACVRSRQGCEEQLTCNQLTGSQ